MCFVCSRGFVFGVVVSCGGAGFVDVATQVLVGLFVWSLGFMLCE